MNACVVKFSWPHAIVSIDKINISWGEEKLQRVFLPFRPTLVSLDLSYNILPDLEAAVHVLAELSSLRSLLLMGNPLSVSTHVP